MFMPIIQAGHLADPFITASNTANATSTATNNVPTFSAQALGDADPSRIIAVAVSAGANGVNRSIFSVTVAGSALTKRVGAVADNSGVENFRAEIWSAALASGTSGDVVVTMSGNIDTNRGVAISVHRLIGDCAAAPDANVPIDGDEDDDTTAAITLSVNTEKKGYVLAVGVAFDVPPASATWVGATELTDSSTNNVIHSVAAHATTIDETPRTITVDFADGGYTQAACSASWFPARS